MERLDSFQQQHLQDYLNEGGAWLIKSEFDSQHVTACCLINSSDGSSGRMLITARPRHLDLYSINYSPSLNQSSDLSSVLTLQTSVVVPGPIEHLDILGPDSLLAVNKKSQFMVISISQSMSRYEMKATMRGTLEDSCFRPLEKGTLLAVDSQRRFFVYIGSQGILRLVPLLRSSSGKNISSTFDGGSHINFGHIKNLRLLELNIVSIKFFVNPSSTTRDDAYLAVLYQESGELYKVRTYRIDWSSPSNFSEQRHFPSQAVISLGDSLTNAQRLVSTFQGMAIVASNGIGFMKDPKATALDFMFPFNFTSDILAVCPVDINSSSQNNAFLLSDNLGTMYFVDIEKKRAQSLGRLDPIQTMCYIDKALLFAAGTVGYDSRLIQLKSIPSTLGKDNDVKNTDDYFGNSKTIFSSLSGAVDCCLVGGGGSDDSTAMIKDLVVCCGSNSELGIAPQTTLAILKNGLACSTDTCVELVASAPLVKLFYVYLPPSSDHNVDSQNDDNDNNRSCFIVADALGNRIVLDGSTGDVAHHLESNFLELVKGARGLRILPHTGSCYSFSEKSIFCLAPKLELIYKNPAPASNPTRNFLVSYPLAIIHNQLDLNILWLQDSSNNGITKSYTLKIDQEIASIALHRVSQDETLMAIVQWDRQVKCFAIKHPDISCELQFSLDISTLKAPRDICFLEEEESEDPHSASKKLFIVLADCTDELKIIARQSAQVSLLKLKGPMRFEPFLDKIIIVGPQPHLLTVSHGLVRAIPLLLPSLRAFVDLGMARYTALTDKNILLQGTVHIEDQGSGKQLTRHVISPGFNPKNICAVHNNSSLLVLTTQSSLVDMGKIRLVGYPDARQLDSFPLLPNEQPYSLLCCGTNLITDSPHHFHSSMGGVTTDNSISLVIVGTAFEGEDDLEPSKGRLLVLQCSANSKRLRLWCQTEVSGCIYSLGLVCNQSRLIAAINGTNVVYKLSVVNNTIPNMSKFPLHSSNSLNSFVEESPSPSSTSKPTLTAMASKFGQICAVTMSTDGFSNDIILGDLLKSAAWLRLETADGACNLESVAYDLASHWMLSVFSILNKDRAPPTQLNASEDEESEAQMARQVALGSDTSGNLFLYGIVPDIFMNHNRPQQQCPQYALKSVSAFYMGSPIVKIMPTNSSCNSGGNSSKSKDNMLLLMSESGQVWRAQRVTVEEHYQILQKLQQWLSERLVQHNQHWLYRQWLPENAPPPPMRSMKHSSQSSLLFIDGDLLLSYFDDLSAGERLQCATHLNVDASILDLFLKTYLI